MFSSKLHSMTISGSSSSLSQVEVGRGGPCLNFINERRELYMYKPNWQNKCNRQAQRWLRSKKMLKQRKGRERERGRRK